MLSVPGGDNTVHETPPPPMRGFYSHAMGQVDPHSLPLPFTSSVGKGMLAYCQLASAFFAIIASATTYSTATVLALPPHFWSYTPIPCTDGYPGMLCKDAFLFFFFSTMDFSLVVNQSGEKKGISHATMMLMSL